jgi:putative oxidoreductase
LSTLELRRIVQRLFSTFADGWPGGGLLMQRLLAGAVLVYYAVVCLQGQPFCSAYLPHAIGALAGVLLLAGLWTPVAGIVVAIAEVWIALSPEENVSMAIVLAIHGATLAMIGPGAWSVDAMLYGRKPIEPPEW